jgi:hypothetical protein
MATIKYALSGCLLLGACLAQTPPGTPAPGKAPGKTSLESLLEESLRYNADIRVAEARLLEAQAQLSKVRLEVTQKVVMAEAALRQAEQTLQTASKRYEQLKAQLEQGLNSEVNFAEAKQAVEQARAAREMAQAMLDTLTSRREKRPGMGAMMGAGGIMGLPKDPAANPDNKPKDKLGNLRFDFPSGNMMGGRLFHALQLEAAAPVTKPLELDLSTLKAEERTLAKLVDLVQDQPGYEGIFAPRGKDDAAPWNTTIPAYKAMTLSLPGLLQLLEDDCKVFFVIRPYGLRPVSERGEGLYWKDYRDYILESEEEEEQKP